MHVAVAHQAGEVTVVVHPADRAVPPDDPVFDIVEIFVGHIADLLINRTAHGLVIIGMNHAAKILIAFAKIIRKGLFYSGHKQ